MVKAGKEKAGKVVKLKTSKVKKKTGFKKFKEQMTEAYLFKYGKPPTTAKSTLNAIMGNDFKLDGVKELWTQDGVVAGFVLPDYRQEQLSTLEFKGFAPTLNKHEPGRVSAEILAHIVNPDRGIDKSMWSVNSVNSPPELSPEIAEAIKKNQKLCSDSKVDSSVVEDKPNTTVNAGSDSDSGSVQVKSKDLKAESA